MWFLGCVALRYAAIPHESEFGCRLLRHDQYMTANPLCRLPKTPQIAGFSRFGCGLQSRALRPCLAKNSPNSPSLSPALWTSRLSSPQDGFRNSLQLNELRVVSGEQFYGINAYPAGCERVQRVEIRCVRPPGLHIRYKWCQLRLWIERSPIELGPCTTHVDLSAEALPLRRPWDGTQR